ncbi:ferrous iron transport protein B [Gudongella sp. SC589]|jgi:ferrous iron transport protein B|uniref:ferrous iron transport protein B n=1 Tax=Gudongella sp. SC589 TaxID=3385990 RepID=UPI003904A20C
MQNIALVGNPNSGKTTLFNVLTGSNQHVGNWPGVTVEKKEGSFKHKGALYNVVDLPGTYSLGAYSEDELVARDFIVKGNPDVVINVVDATNLERNLYLTTQLLEMGANVVVALNMMDEAESKQIMISTKDLSEALGVPVISTVAAKKKGIQELIDGTLKAMNQEPRKIVFTYGKEIDEEISKIRDLLKDESLPYPDDWTALKLLEGDQEMLSIVEKMDQVKTHLKSLQADNVDYELDIVDKRYAYVNGITKKCVVKPAEEIVTATDKIDRILTSRLFGLPIFGLIMYLVFQLTFVVGSDILGGYVETAIEIFGEFVEGWLVSVGSPDWLVSFVIEGFVGGVGAVLVFVPLIMVLYFFLAILEDTGYMSRAAYIMDGIMRAVGLHGKTFISMIVGFGCNVPGIMATRTLENKKDRMIAILINPFMSCGARLPIYLVFIAAFFPNNGGLVLFIIYALGIGMALLMGKLFSKTLFKGESSHFIMELPPYRLPSPTSVLRDMWEKVWDFVKRAGTVIFAVVALLWVMSVLPMGVEPYSQESILGRVGQFIAPLFAPAGFGTWQASVSLFAGIAAKEAVVAVLGMVYAGVSEGSELVNAIRDSFTTLSAVSFLVMTLLYTPCAAVIATVKKETNSYKWAAFMAIYPFVLAWSLAVLVYQIGSLMGF